MSLLHSFGSTENKVNRDLVQIDGLFNKTIERRKEEQYTPCSQGCSSTSQKSHPLNVVMNMTWKCNIACDYCYTNSSPTATGEMSVEVATKAIQEMLEVPKYSEIDLAFHGGEPFLRFNEMVEIVEQAKSLKPSKRIKYSVQTNATVLNHKHAKFIKENDIQVGVSLDGYGALHDIHRKYVNGKGSFKAVKKGLSYLKEFDIRFGVLLTVTSSNYNHLADILDYFMEDDLTCEVKHYCFNPVTAEGRARKFNQIGVSSDQYFEGMRDVLEKLIEYNSSRPELERISERNLRYTVKNLTVGQSYMCLSSPCGAGTYHIAFGPEGDVYPCDTITGNQEFRMGNIMDDKLTTILQQTPVVDFFQNRNVTSIEPCNTCNWKHVCAGGCPTATLAAYGDMYRNGPLCGYSKKMIPHLIDLIYVQKLDLSLLRPNPSS